MILIKGIVFSLLLAQPTVKDDQRGSWPIAMAHSKIAMESPYVKQLRLALQRSLEPKRSVATSARPESSAGHRPVANTSLDPGAFGLGPDVPSEIFERMRVYGRLKREEREVGLKMIREGKLADGRAYLERLMMAQPDEYYAIPLLEVEFKQGDFVSAYKVAASLIRPNSSPQFLVRASLAAAMCGEVYQGQREFVANLVFGRADAKEIPQSMPDDTAEGLAALSFMAIGKEYASWAKYSEAEPYCEAALRMDAGNPSFSLYVAHCYAASARYTAAVRALEIGLGRAKTQDCRESLEFWKKLFFKLLMRYGDGHLANDSQIYNTPPAVTGAIHP